MKFKDLKTKNIEELKKLESDFRAELFILRFKNTTGQLDKNHKISSVKKNISQVLTAINQHLRKEND